MVAEYWYGFLGAGILSLVVAVALQLRNMKNLLTGGFSVANEFSKPGVVTEDAVLRATKREGSKLIVGVLLVAVFGLVGAVVTLVGLIGLVVHLAK